ncbi:hypothetical protein JRQ81_015828 [Phrynocephalus forsythii]|uniref:Uncharacterized protein n=1 Tax=Phrynocephalus forsythii TaxID=171643 RepID=A0A9Q0XWM1_9SAUR|nr:hypothetical protein JRQ81_015828 [Phrynocephalus forsythii]
MLEGRFKGTPLQNRTCPCGEGVETLAHVLLFCSFYREVRQELLFPMLAKKPGRSSDFYISLLLGDRDNQGLSSLILGKLVDAFHEGRLRHSGCSVMFVEPFLGQWNCRRWVCKAVCK